jgi:hypothetical protein
MLHHAGSPPKISGMILQKAFGYKPLSMFFMALCTSSLEAETPRAIYLFSADIRTEISLSIFGGKGNIFVENNFE